MATRSFAVAVDSEADIAIVAETVTVQEDQGPFALDLDVAAVDADGSEFIDDVVTVTFTDIPSGGMVLSDGTSFAGPTGTWTGTPAELRALGVQSLPEHFSGIISGSVTATSNEGDPAGATKAFQIKVEPVAEVVARLSVSGDDVDGATVIVKEDGGAVPQDAGDRASFTVRMEAETADKDGSEELTELTLFNVPQDWIALFSDWSVDPAAFVSGFGEVADARFVSVTPDHGNVVITLVGGLDSWTGELRLTPTQHTDLDVETIAGADLQLEASSRDAAAGLPDDTATALSDAVDVDLDAVADGAEISTRNQNANENMNATRSVRLRIDDLSLVDQDGSESYRRVVVDIDLVSTESDTFDASSDAFLRLVVPTANASHVTITRAAGGTADEARFIVEPAPGATTAQFEAAVQNLRIVVPKNFSGRLEAEGFVESQETLTGDGEFDSADSENLATTNFGPTVMTVRPVAEAELTASVFVTDASDLATAASPASPASRPTAPRSRPRAR